MKRLEAILKRAAGLDTASIGRSLVRRAVQARMRASGVSSLDLYHRLVLTTKAERAALVQEAVVTETWFFRDRGPVDTLVQFLISEWLPVHPGGRARLLSLPCSTGEEPCSIVMALKDARVPDDRFTIDAVDLSEKALGRARAGVYRNNSFRGKDLAFRQRHFTASGNSWTISPVIRDKVRFLHGDLLDEKFIGSLGTYDFIFCRNLWIYFDAAGRTLATRHLHRLLKRDGLCFFGAVELPLVLGRGFEQTAAALGSGCRKEMPPRTAHQYRESIPSPARLHLRLRRVAGAPMASGIGNPLELARQLADDGKVAEAVRTCELHLEQDGLSAEAHFFLGRLRQSLGATADAAECFRRALFLNPDHYEAVQRLADLATREGNFARAAALQQRATRLQSPATPAHA